MEKLLITESGEKVEKEADEVNISVIGENQNVYLKGVSNRVLMNSVESVLHALVRKSSVTLTGAKLDCTIFGYGNTVAAVGDYHSEYTVCDEYSEYILSVSHSTIVIFGSGNGIAIKGSHNTIVIQNSAKHNHIRLQGLHNNVTCVGSNNTIIELGHFSTCKSTGEENSIFYGSLVEVTHSQTD